MLPAKREGERERKHIVLQFTHAFLKHSVKPNKAPTHPQYTCTLVQRIFALIWRDGRDILLLAKGIHYTTYPLLHALSILPLRSLKSPPKVPRSLYFTSPLSLFSWPQTSTCIAPKGRSVAYVRRGDSKKLFAFCFAAFRLFWHGFLQALARSLGFERAPVGGEDQFWKSCRRVKLLRIFLGLSEALFLPCS